jgi:hypothetical protein
MPRLADTIAEPPPWLAEYLTFVEAVGLRPNAATDALRFADLFLYETLLAGNPLPESVLNTFVTPGDELRRTVRTAAYFARRIWGVNCALIERLLTDSDSGNQAEVCQPAIENSRTMGFGPTGTAERPVAAGGSGPPPSG